MSCEPAVARYSVTSYSSTFAKEKQRIKPRVKAVKPAFYYQNSLDHLTSRGLPQVWATHGPE